MTPLFFAYTVVVPGAFFVGLTLGEAIWHKPKRGSEEAPKPKAIADPSAARYNALGDEIGKLNTGLQSIAEKASSVDRDHEVRIGTLEEVQKHMNVAMIQEAQVIRDLQAQELEHRCWADKALKEEIARLVVRIAGLEPKLRKTKKRSK